MGVHKNKGHKTENEQIEKEYQHFLEKSRINPKTGILQANRDKRFATLPYIGSDYFSAKKKILFVGLDMGCDELHQEDRYQNLEERKMAIDQDYAGFNPHIAGTYCSALFLLKEENNWQDAWEKFANHPSQSFVTASKKENRDNSINPLSFVALTNLFKFVTVGRRDREGATDRRFIDKEKEVALLIKEIEILKPDVVLFQSKKMKWQLGLNILQKIKQQNIEVVLAHHPAYRKKGGKIPANYVLAFDYVQ